MRLDWNTRRRLEEQNIVLQAQRSKRAPNVTVGVPTFNRPHTIERALASLARQTYRDFVVIVSDNAGRSQATLDAVGKFANDLPEVYVVAQENNIGALANLNYLLACASTQYFMWLADDDEVSENYLQELVTLLESDPAAVSAMGRRRRMTNGVSGALRESLNKSARFRPLRVFRYIAFETDDSLFYGLHRTDRLRRCQFEGYHYPNIGVLTNFCYVFLFDMLWQGHVQHGREATWIFHDEPQKAYQKAAAGGVANKLKTLARRVNVYALYCAKATRHNPAMVLVSVPASLIGFTRDVTTALGRVAARRGARRVAA